MPTTIKPYGAWPSPLTADSLASGVTATDVCVDAATQSVYWTEIVSNEGGRGQIFSKSLSDPNSEPRALLPQGYDCRTRVHEYGGGAFLVQDGLLVFSNDKDARLYKVDLGNGTFMPLTPADKLWRFADLAIDVAHGYLVCVREEHFEKEEPKDVINTLVAVPLDGSANVQVVAEGCDFYASPRFYKDNLAYVCWNHSNMPWDFTKLCLAKVVYENGAAALKSGSIIVGNEIDESIVQPTWGADGTLFFASDRSGFWNLYKYASGSVASLLPKPVEQEFADAAWRLNESWYAPLADPSKLVCINKEHLAVLDVTQGTLTNIDNWAYNNFSQIRTHVHQGADWVIVNAASPTQATTLVAYDLGTQAIQQIVRPSKSLKLDAGYIAEGEEIEFPTTGGKTAYAYFYPPKNPEYSGPEGEKPPLRVLSHGGPTTSASRIYSGSIQYWTTRGFAIVNVNYGGSTGYGREYRNRLKKQWGVVDIDDCCNAALYLAKQGRVDPEKLAIAGGSAGGFTTLASLAFRDVFKAGCCMYGISDITLLAKETHKFESRYPDELIGEYPKDKKIYEERSPLFSADKITCPVIFFQGSEDKVVPPSQSEIMVNALKDGHVPVAYQLYEGEQHGFRRAENIKRTVELEQWFYGQIFGFPVEEVEGIKIYNFPSDKA